MTVHLEYGAERPLNLEVLQDRLLCVYGDLPTEPFDISRSVSAALSHPLGFPPLAAATTVGDRIVIALAPGVACGGQIAACVARQLLDFGSSLNDMAMIHRADDPAARDYAASFAAAGLAELELIPFDPTNASECSYLAASKDAQPIYLARRIIDADLVLPILPLLPKGSWSTLGFRGGLFPTFAPEESRSRFGNLAALPKSRRKELAKASEEAWWLLGTLCCLGVAGGLDQVFAVRAGEPKLVATALRESLAAQLSPIVHQSPPLAIAGISAIGKHTWRQLAAALAASTRLVPDGGTVVICSNLSAPPGPGVAKFMENEGSLSKIEQWLAEGLADVDVAWQIFHATENRHVALLSSLSPVLVEDLGMIPLASPLDVQRIIARHPQCVILHHAQLVAPHVERLAEEEKGA